MKDSDASRLLSHLLRHEPAKYGVTLEHGGWVSMDVLLAALAKDKKGKKITLDQIKSVVATGGRHFFNEDGTKIRAAQGHSADVELDLPVQTPPDKLLHGTAERFMPLIQADGKLKSMSRQDVHLITSRQTAIEKGARYGVPVVLEIDAAAMHKDGYQFKLADNGIWLVNEVPLQYVKDVTKEN